MNIKLLIRLMINKQDKIINCQNVIHFQLVWHLILTN